MRVRFRRVVFAVPIAALTSGVAGISPCAPPAWAAEYGSDPIPLTPYGMDPVPPAVFYRGAWDRYGSDPTPQSATSDLGFHDIYGLDAIPKAVVPSIQEMRDVLPHHALQVLTRAIEGGALEATDAPAGCRP
jgi:hypothetical protein